jgi:hypothetical protein
MRLFLTGFAQVFLVTVQTFFIAKVFYMGVLIVGFLISIVWSWNVKKVAFGSKADRVLYSSGAACGAVCGLFLSQIIYNIL